MNSVGASCSHETRLPTGAHEQEPGTTDDQSHSGDQRTPDAPRDGAAAVQQQLAYDRTFLANERTYAAWLRTGLAIAAGGIAVAHLVPEPSRDSWIALALGSAFVLAGVSVMWYGAREFAATSATLARESGRAGALRPHLPYLLTAALGVLLLAVLLFLWTHQGRVETSPDNALPSTAARPVPREPANDGPVLPALAGAMQTQMLRASG